MGSDHRTGGAVETLRSTRRRVLAAGPELARALWLQSRAALLPPRNGARSEGLIVTLSSIPSRIGGIIPTLNSLLDQTVPPDTIVIALPERSRREGRTYEVPAQVANDPRIRLIRAERDWGPATKLIPTLRAHAGDPSVRVLALDDDHIYPRRFLESYLCWAAELPGAALSMRGCAVPPSRRWRDCEEFNGTSLMRPVRTDIVEGCSGILVRPEFFDAEFFDYDPAPPEAFFVDDVWISGHLARRGVPAYIVPFTGAFVYLPVLSALRGARLHRGENRTGHNNDVMLEYFGSHWGWP